jgi:hypothetical protein
MKTLIKFLALLYVGPVFGFFIECMKGRLIKPYQHLINHIRVIFFIGFFAYFALIVMVCGFVLFPVALYLYLPWTAEDKALLLLILSGAYFLVPCVFLLWFYSYNSWLKFFGAKALESSIKKD